MNSKEFRKELVKIMPGYKWTVHRRRFPDSNYLEATGIKSSGSNRLSTLYLRRDDEDGPFRYEAKSSGFGKRAPWLSNSTGRTLAKALRGLQNHYENVALLYRNHATELKTGRQVPI